MEAALPSGAAMPEVPVDPCVGEPAVPVARSRESLRSGDSCYVDGLQRTVPVKGVAEAGNARRSPVAEEFSPYPLQFITFDGQRQLTTAAGQWSDEAATGAISEFKSRAGKCR